MRLPSADAAPRSLRSGADDRQAGEAADLVRRAVRALLVQALADARSLVAAHRPLLTAVADALLDAETLDAAQLQALRGLHDGARQLAPAG